MYRIVCVAAALLSSACNREKASPRADSEFANPHRTYVPGSDPGVTPGGGSSSQSSNTMTTPPLVDQSDKRLPGTPETALGDGGKEAGAGSSGPTAGGQGSADSKKPGEK